MDTFSVHVALVGVAVLYFPETKEQFDFPLHFSAPVALRSDSGSWTLLTWFRIHTQKHQVSGTPGRVISPSQRTLPDNTQHSQETDIHAPGRIRTHNPRRRAAENSRIKPRGHWDWQFPSFTSVLKLKAVCTVSIIM